MSPRGEELKYDYVEWAGVTIAYSWCHSRRKTLGITIHPNKSVSVRVPLRTSLKAIREFVTVRAEWVLKVWKKLDAQPIQQQQEYGRGSVFMFQGKAFRLEFTRGIKRSIDLHDGLLILTVPSIPTEEIVRKMIDRWYRKQAIESVKERSIECHRRMQEERIPLPQITIRSMKTRWGSYSYLTRRISLNLNLIKMPQACLDYVIIHELCHLKEMNHQKGFWTLVAQFCPRWREHKKWLVDHQAELSSRLST